MLRLDESLIVAKNIRRERDWMVRHPLKKDELYFVWVDPTHGDIDIAIYNKDSKKGDKNRNINGRNTWEFYIGSCSEVPLEKELKRWYQSVIFEFITKHPSDAKLRDNGDCKWFQSVLRKMGIKKESDWALLEEMV